MIKIARIQSLHWRAMQTRLVIRSCSIKKSLLKSFWDLLIRGALIWQNYPELLRNRHRLRSILFHIWSICKNIDVKCCWSQKFRKTLLLPNIRNRSVVSSLSNWQNMERLWLQKSTDLEFVNDDTEVLSERQIIIVKEVMKRKYIRYTSQFNNFH